MNIALPFLILGILFVAAAGLAYYLASLELKLAQALDQFSRQRGWTFQRHPKNRRAYQFYGCQEEISWEITLYRNARNQLPSTVWISEHLCPERQTVVIGAGLEHLFAPTRHDSSQMHLRTPGWGVYTMPDILGLDSLGVDLHDLEPQAIGGEVIRQHYQVFAPDQTSAEAILSPEVEQQLLAWPITQSLVEAPLIIASDGQVAIRLAHDRAAAQPELLERLVNLGLVLCKTSKPMIIGNPH